MRDPAPPSAPGAPLPAADARAAALLGRGFLGLVALVFGLIVLGALVRAHGAGLSCPDWPLCFGRVIPRFNLRVAFEYTHRVVAGSVTLVFLGLGIGLMARPATRRLGLPLWLVAAALLAIQVVLGALTVWHLLASWTVTAHLVTGNTFNACLLLLGLRLREAAAGRAVAPGPVSPAARTLATGALVLLALQIVLGGLVSSTHAGLACTGWPTCSDGVFFPNWRGPVGLHLMHRTNGYLLLLLLLATAAVARGRPRLGRLTALAAGAAVAQVGVGVANVLLRLPIEVTALHSALAAALVLLLVASVREAWRGAHP
jgi:cytochrome c oxidase assembly protein subunit 15